jgi:hypothetical protein
MRDIPGFILVDNFINMEAAAIPGTQVINRIKLEII